jgi:OFA family oxalate/formate antiporter-like MFS transporter
VPISLPRAVLAVAAATLINLSLGSLYAWSVFVRPLEDALGASRSETSVVFSVATVTFTLAMLLAPRLYGRLSAPALAILALGTAAAGHAIAAAAGTRLWPIVLGYGGLFGIANGIGYGLSLQVVQAALEHRRGLATGVVVAAYTLGAAAFTPVFEGAIGALGIGDTFLVAGGWMLAAAVVATWCLARASVRLHPVAAGRGAWGAHRGTFVWLWLGFLAAGSAGVMSIGHAAPIVATYGGSEAQAALAVALVAIGNGMGRFGGGWLADLVPPQRGLLMMQILQGLALLLPVVLPGVPAVLAAMLLVGIGYGANASFYPLAVARYFGADQMARIYGRLFTAWGVAGLAAPYIAGLLFDWSGSYNLAIGLGVAAAAFGAFTSLRLPPVPSAR